MYKDELSKVWKEVILSLEPIFTNKNVYDNCIVPTSIIGFDNNVLSISVPSIFAKSILVNDCKDKIDEIIRDKLQANIKIEFLLPDEKKLVRFDKDIVDTTFINDDSGLIKDYTLNNFVVGEFNRSAYNAVCAISNRLGQAYNPLFIHGSTGLGKTHLMIGLGNLFADRYPNKKVKYIESDIFVRDVFSALSKGSNFIEELKDYYNSIDLLLIDDIQYLSGKEKTNEIFFSIFNNLVKRNKHIVITSDKSPDSLDSLEERMVSRFNSGLTIKINKPEVEALKRIIMNKISEDSSSIMFNDEAISEIVKYYNNDLRKLIGFINQISFYAIQNLNSNDIITKDIVKKFIDQNSTINLSLDIKINPEIIIATICKWFSVKEELVRGKSRIKSLVNVRHICMYILRDKLDMSYVEIGKLFSNRDHTTIMSGVEKISKQLEKDESLRKYISDLYSKLG